jgi:hypothetical protein
MPFSRFYQDLRSMLADQFPSTVQLGDRIELELLISPHRLKLPLAIKHQAEAAIKAHAALVQNSKFQSLLSGAPDWLKPLPACPKAILTAYDFHTTEQGQVYLVEINTNASSFLLSVLAYESQALPATWNGRPAADALRAAFIEDGKQLFNRPIEHCAIVDDEVAQQKMFIEFLMYQDWFKTMGWQARAVNADDIHRNGDHLEDEQKRPVQFIYNRLTDFYLADDRFADLKVGFSERLAAVSPNPSSYHLLADKARLVEMSRPGWLESAGASGEQLADLKKVLIPTFELQEYGSSERLWNERKGLFFKPRRSHGGKSVYRGSSVSKKVFERLMAEDTLVQNYVPAQALPASPQEEFLKNWKFDLRFYVYGSEIHLAIARCYQGQVTNFSSRFGGLATVEFADK